MKHKSLVLAFLAMALPAWPASYYTRRLEDPNAVYIAGPTAGDNTALLQQAVDRVHETSGQGIVFLAQGRYRVSDTLFIWPGIRVIGHGSERPVIVLPEVGERETESSRASISVS